MGPLGHIFSPWDILRDAHFANVKSTILEFSRENDSFLFLDLSLKMAVKSTVLDILLTVLNVVFLFKFFHVLFQPVFCFVLLVISAGKRIRKKFIRLPWCKTHPTAISPWCYLTFCCVGVVSRIFICSKNSGFPDIPDALLNSHNLWPIKDKIMPRGTT